MHSFRSVRLAPFVLLALGVSSCLFLGCKSEPAGAPGGQAGHGYGERAYAHTAAIVAIGPRPPGSEGLDRARAYVTAELAKHGWVAVAQVFEVATPKGPMTMTNLIARFKGATTTPEAILCAHIDSKLMVGSEFVGADDAASAVAAIVEIARVLAEEPARAERVELVFFDGEESIESNITETDGLYGSNHYAKAWQGEVAKPRFGILLDMIGHRDLRIRIPSDSPAHLRAALMAAAEKRGALEHFGIARGPIIDDHVPLNQAGVATIDVIGDFSSTTWWHTPADNLALIDPQSLEISIGTTLEMLRSLLP
jgi:glutaminyl-peptide cyclotransferase